MPAPFWRKDSSVIEELLHAPEGVPFLQAVRLLERSTTWANKGSGQRHSHNVVGQFTPPASEIVRFHAQVSLGFPSHELVKISQKSTALGLQWHMVTCFMGLTGSTGILPFHYTELLFQRLKLKDESFKKFLDLFNHRSISLFYQASTKYRLPLAYEREKLLPSRRDRSDNHTQALLSLMGLGTAHLQEQLNVRPESLVFFAGLLSQATRPAVSVKQMLAHFFGVPVAINEFVGQWHDLIPDVRSRLPTPGNSKGQNACLGRSAIVGGKGWFVQGKMQVVLGPLNDEQFKRFAPGTGNLKRLNEMAKLYAGAEVETEYVLRVARRNIPSRMQLRQSGPPTLGWDSWLSSSTHSAGSGDGTVDIKVSPGQINQ